MLRSLLLVAALAASSILTGCAVRARARPVPPPAPTAELVAIGDDTWVVSDYDDPVFYVDGYYWRYDGFGWYRSPYLGSWVSVSPRVVPRRVIGIDRPRRYRHYRAPRGARVRVAPARARGRAVVRGDRRPRRRAVRQDRRQRRQADRRDRRRTARQGRRGRPAATGARVRARPDRGRATGARVRVRP